MAISTYKTYLMYKATSSATSYTQLVDITSFPDIGGDPEQLETTTLSNAMRTHINGIQNTDSMQFEANYTKTDYDKIKALTGSTPFAVFFGGTTTSAATDGTYYFTGTPSVKISGGGVNEVVHMTITISLETEVTTSEPN